MYWVEWFCPLDGLGVQRSERAYQDYDEAVAWAKAMKPPRGWGRVMTQYGNMMFYIGPGAVQ